MIYFTGDTHRDIDIHKLSSVNFNIPCTKDDYMVVLGDFGCVWDGSKSDAYWLDWLEDKPFTTLFIPGNHENYTLLREYTLEEWNGGCVRKIRPSVIMLERGYVFDLCDRSFFCMGGADSYDKQYRKEGISWWADEMPSDAEYGLAYDNLSKRNWTVDYVLTHCSKRKDHSILTDDPYSTNRLIDFLILSINA